MFLRVHITFKQDLFSCQIQSNVVYKAFSRVQIKVGAWQ